MKTLILIVAALALQSCAGMSKNEINSRNMALVLSGQSSIQSRNQDMLAEARARDPEFAAQFDAAVSDDVLIIEVCEKKERCLLKGR